MMIRMLIMYHQIWSDHLTTAFHADEHRSHVPVLYSHKSDDRGSLEQIKYLISRVVDNEDDKSGEEKRRKSHLIIRVLTTNITRRLQFLPQQQLIVTQRSINWTYHHHHRQVPLKAISSHQFIASRSTSSDDSPLLCPSDHLNDVNQTSSLCASCKYQTTLVARR